MQNKNWINIHRVISSVKWLDENICEINNIRNFKYNYHIKDTENNPEILNYENEKYDLRDLKKVWFIENKWADIPFHSHIMISFEFVDNRFITFGLEVRKRDDDIFQLYKVFWKTYNVFYVVAKEEDILYLRTNVRDKSRAKTFLHELNLNKYEAVNLFKTICASVDDYRKKDIVYKVFKTDCVSGMMQNFINAGIKVKKYFWDYSPTAVLQRSGLIENTVQDINESVTKDLKQNPEFSLKIREDLL